MGTPQFITWTILIGLSPALFTPHADSQPTRPLHAAGDTGNVEFAGGAETGACCQGTLFCSILTEFDCEDEGHTWLGPNTLCANCPALPECNETGVLFHQQVADPVFESSASTSESNPNLAIFDNFRAVGGGVDSITWWGLDLRFTGGQFVECEELNNTFLIAFHNDASGQPGDIVCSSIVSATRTPLNIRYNGAELNEYQAVLASPCILTRGWISISGGGDPQCWFLWMTSPDGDNLAYCQGCGVGPQATDYAFCLQGQIGGIYGACCEDDSANCMDEKIEITQCLDDGMRFAPNQTCDSLNPPCGTLLGACCISAFECSSLTLAGCATQNGNWLGPNSLCAQCPCTAYCPPHGRPEPEPPCGEGFVDSTNGGCNVSPHVFTPIDIGDVVCGRAGFYDGGGEIARDADWYELTVNAPTDISWEIVAEFTVRISIIDASSGCPGAVLDSSIVPPCLQHAAYWFADQPGTFWLVVESVGFNDVDSCPAKYTATIPSPFGCMPGDVNQDQARDGHDVQGLVDCILVGSTPGGNCPCADMNFQDGPTIADIPLFVTGLLN